MENVRCKVNFFILATNLHELGMSLGHQKQDTRLKGEFAGFWLKKEGFLIFFLIYNDFYGKKL